MKQVRQREMGVTHISAQLTTHRLLEFQKVSIQFKSLKSIVTCALLHRRNLELVTIVCELSSSTYIGSSRNLGRDTLTVFFDASATLAAMPEF